MRNLYLTITLCLISFFSISQSLEVLEDWNVSCGNQNTYIEVFSKLTINGELLAGGSTITNNGDYDAIISKYDDRGQLLWSYTYSNSTTNGDDAFTSVEITNDKLST